MNIDQVLAALGLEYDEEIPRKLLASAKVFTSKEYLDAFKKKWGYSVSAKGYTIDGRDWSSIMQFLGGPKEAEGFSYYVDGNGYVNNSFCIVKQSARCGPCKEHEMLHLALREHSQGFEEIYEHFTFFQGHTLDWRLRYAESGILNEILAFRGMLRPGADKEAFWKKYEGIISRNYVSVLKNDYHVSSFSYLKRDTKKIIGLVKNCRMSPKELFQAFAELDYDMPFAEAITALQ